MGKKHLMDATIPESWDEEADVIIVGSGFAGLAAAIEAKNAGASVIILEKMKGYGGNSTISDGVIAAAGTTLQKKFAIQDSPQLMYSDMMKAGLGLNHPKLAKIVAEESAKTFHWTVDFLGVQYLERVRQFGGHTVPRGHSPQKGGGAAIIRQLLNKVISTGMSIRTKTYLKKILTDSNNRVRGVLVMEGYVYADENSGFQRYIKAKKAVILATGGFANDIDFRSMHDPQLDETVDSTNKYSTTGESLREAMSINAMPVHLSRIQLGPWSTPDEKGYGIGPLFLSYAVFPYGIVVNPKTGRRVMNELDDRKTRCDIILQTGHPCIGIADSKGIEASGHDVNRALKRGIVKKFEGIEKLAEGYNMPVQPFKKTVQQFCEAVIQKKDKAFGKPILKEAQPLEHPPFYAIRIWPKVHYTAGGISINSNSRVLDLEGQPIPGFFAAGEVTGGIHGASRLGGCAITDCLVFGRIAGRNAVNKEL